MNHNMFEGQKVRLRGVRPEDWEHFLQWDLDNDAQRYGWNVWPPPGTEAAREFARQESAKRPDRDEFRLIIETLDGAPAGSLNVHGVDQRRGSFEYGIALAREHWGNGYGEEAIALLLRYMFGELRYNKVQAWVYAFNERSAAMHRKFGMVLEGTVRESHFTDGRYWDSYLFGMTRSEYAEKYGAHWGDLPR